MFTTDSTRNLTDQCIQSRQLMLWCRSPRLQRTFCTCNKTYFYYHKITFLKNWASRFYTDVDSPSFAKEMVSYDTENCTPQRTCGTWLLRSASALLLFLDAIYHIYAENFAVKVPRTIFNETIFRISGNISLEMHPRIFFLGACQAPAVCYNALLMVVRQITDESLHSTVIFVESSTSQKLI